jgi:TatD DNase family protein
MLIDTHCHIHESDYPLDTDEVIKRAKQAGVNQIICVGTNTEDSKLALGLAMKNDGVFASVGIHPHHADDGAFDLKSLVDSVYLGNGFVPGPIRAPAPFRTRAAGVSSNKGVQQDPSIPTRKLVAIGEIGLDYHYPKDPSHSSQIKLLKQQIKLALEHDLPIIFHVREAYDDFWKVLDSIKSDKPIRGVLHSFTDSIENAKEGLKRGFYISINGISTFTHDKSQKAMFESIPLDKLLLETDAPWLTPYPLRGKIKINEPAFVREVAEYIAKTRNVSFEEIADTTTANAHRLFNL